MTLIAASGVEDSGEGCSWARWRPRAPGGGERQRDWEHACDVRGHGEQDQHHDEDARPGIRHPRQEQGMYRVTHQVDSNLPLASKQKFKEKKRNFWFDVNGRSGSAWCVTQNYNYNTFRGALKRFCWLDLGCFAAWLSGLKLVRIGGTVENIEGAQKKVNKM